VPVNLPVSAALFPQIINNLIDAANLPVHHRGGNALRKRVTQNDIVLVVLHVHSYYDPCAKCSKVLSGLSRQMNMPVAVGLNTQSPAMAALLDGVAFAGGDGLPAFGTANGFADIADLVANLRLGATKFLIEVSSESEYLYHKNNCSFAELAGHDNNTANPITININPNVPTAINFAATENQELSIPQGIGVPNNWSFPTTFPPYVIYGRISAGQIANAPAGRCDTSNNHNTTLTAPPPLRSAS